jgi:GMP synthase-like glutamine amidotransferase
MHRDIVFEFPKDAIPLASNDICTVQAMYSPGKYIAVQGHPEFTEALISEVLAIRHGQGIFSDEIYEDAMKRAGIEHDGVAIARGFLRFLKSG